jgi:hypothetical protein
MRLSGMGRELGIEGLDAFREPKHVHLDWHIEAKPYWYPYKWKGVPGAGPKHPARKTRARRPQRRPGAKR